MPVDLYLCTKENMKFFQSFWSSLDFSQNQTSTFYTKYQLKQVTVKACDFYHHNLVLSLKMIEIKAATNLFKKLWKFWKLFQFDYQYYWSLDIT